MARGFLYLVVIMDWVSRAVLAWRLSNTLGAEFCVEALEEALSLHGRPEIFNTDQGSQFTSDDFTATLERHEVTISMDGKGRYMDNIFVQRLWRSLKYEEVYLNAYAGVAEAKAGIGSWLGSYNEERQHQSLLALPPYCPELNPVENIWEFLRGNYLSNRVFDTYDAILDACCQAWNAFIADPERIRSVTAREWAQVNL
jgi:transposase InsO family protein